MLSPSAAAKSLEPAESRGSPLTSRDCEVRVVIPKLGNLDLLATLPFPPFPHSVWFEAGCMAGVALLLWVGHIVRVRSVADAIRRRAHEDAEQRIRFARESCDTLLQGLQGLLLSFHAAAQQIPAEHESRKALDRALASADSIIVDARDRITRI
jgi:signal transduction histidine kinase